MKCIYVGCKNQAVYERKTVFNSPAKPQISCVCDKHATDKDKALSTWTGIILGVEFTTTVKKLGENHA